LLSGWCLAFFLFFLSRRKPTDLNCFFCLVLENIFYLVFCFLPFFNLWTSLSSIIIGFSSWWILSQLSFFFGRVKHSTDLNYFLEWLLENIYYLVFCFKLFLRLYYFRTNLLEVLKIKSRLPFLTNCQLYDIFRIFCLNWTFLMITSSDFCSVSMLIYSLFSSWYFLNFNL
jgi:hypothetical protein